MTHRHTGRISCAALSLDAAYMYATFLLYMCYPLCYLCLCVDAAGPAQHTAADVMVLDEEAEEEAEEMLAGMMSPATVYDSSGDEGEGPGPRQRVGGVPETALGGTEGVGGGASVSAAMAALHDGVVLGLEREMGLAGRHDLTEAVAASEPAREADDRGGALGGSLGGRGREASVGSPSGSSPEESGSLGLHQAGGHLRGAHAAAASGSLSLSAPLQPGCIYQAGFPENLADRDLASAPYGDQDVASLKLGTGAQGEGGRGGASATSGTAADQSLSTVAAAEDTAAAALLDEEVSNPGLMGGSPALSHRSYTSPASLHGELPPKVPPGELEEQGSVSGQLHGNASPPSGEGQASTSGQLHGDASPPGGGQCSASPSLLLPPAALSQAQSFCSTSSSFLVPTGGALASQLGSSAQLAAMLCGLSSQSGNTAGTTTGCEEQERLAQTELRFDPSEAQPTSRRPPTSTAAAVASTTAPTAAATASTASAASVQPTASVSAATSAAAAAVSAAAIAGLQLSECGGTLSLGMPLEEAHRAFDAGRVRAEDFAVRGRELMASEVRLLLLQGGRKTLLWGWGMLWGRQGGEYPRKLKITCVSLPA